MQRFYLGAAYYPELWPPAVIDQDLALMAEAGINVVRMGEFAWSTMEPRQDEINLDFFVRIIERLHTQGIATVFCTPTPTPPIWMSHGHPERLFVRSDGAVLGHGSRQHPCTNNPFFCERTRTIVEAVARAVGRLPGVIGWQTDNEFKCHVAECCCAECRSQWHAWLAQRYGTIDALNDAWGTPIWSQEYQEFDQVVQPMTAPYLHNPSLLTAYRLFSYEKIADYQREQVEIIRRFSDAPITHNTNRWFSLDNALLFRDLDFASVDVYAEQAQWRDLLVEFDLWRNTKRGRSFWVMETSSSHTGSSHGGSRNHPEGFVAAEAVTAWASGAEGFSFWCWRQQRTGCELTAGAVVSAWNKPTVGFSAVQAADRARQLCETYLDGTHPRQAEVGITYSDRARAYFVSEPQNQPDYRILMQDWHKLVLEMGIHRDLLFEEADLSGYRVLMTPFVPYLDTDFLARVRAFVEAGGIWIAGPLTGGRTAEHTIPTDAALGELEALAGVETVFTYPLDDTGTTGAAFGVTAPLCWWSGLFAPREARVVGATAGGNTPGLAFLTERDLGTGKVVLLGSMPQGDEGRRLLQAVVGHYAEAAGVTVRAETTAGTIVLPRQSPDGVVWVAVNMDGAGGTVELPGEAQDLVSGEMVPAGHLAIDRFGWRFLRLAGSA